MALELKSVKNAVLAHKKQVNTRLRLRGLRLCHPFRVGDALAKHGILWMIHGRED